MNTEILIHSFSPVLPLHHMPQAKTVDWILKAHERNHFLNPVEEAFDRSKLERFALNESYIQERYFECDDLDENWEEHSTYRLTQATPCGSTIGVRNKIFGEKVQRVFSQLYADETPSQLIHVTCTGYISPSPPQVYFSKRGYSPGITHAYHMGCYAAFPAVRMGMGLHLSHHVDVDIVHNELCSLHLASDTHTPEQMVVQTLFADGHIKYSLGSAKKGLKILGIKEQLIPNSLEDMTWIPDAFGMRMTLSREVPFKIRDALPAFVENLCQDCSISRKELMQNGIFAIHPGGPKIIEAVQKKLELQDEQVSFSKDVLKKRGNMSSATLPHVWHEIFKSDVPDGTKILSLAFGPGLTIFGALFEVRR
jgi:predicted naringenin-chalcone synthase